MMADDRWQVFLIGDELAMIRHVGARGGAESKQHQGEA